MTIIRQVEEAAAAGALALHDFMHEFDGTVCGACGEEKWAKSPFCRLCSIRLQRAHLMRRLDALWASGNELPEMVRYFKHWDLCRDYLINRRREAAA